MPTRSDLSFQLNRVGRFFRTLLGNRRSALGLLLLIVFIGLALGAPIWAPGNPNAAVSGSLAQPEWTTSFPDGFYLSKNIVVVSDPEFTSPAAVQPWALSTSTAVSNVQMSYSPSIHPSSTKGSLQLNYIGGGQAEANVSRAFNFPYHGPPRDFLVDVSVLFSGESTAATVNFRLFIAEGGQVFNLLQVKNENISGAGTWDRLQFSSEDSNVRNATGTTGNSIPTAAIIFSAVDSYSFGLDVTFGGPGRVNIGSAQLFLRGTAYGLLGTDNAGRDLYSQNVYGSQTSLFVGLLAAGIGIGLGLLIGLLAGFLGRLVDELLMRFTDMMLVIPALPLLLVLIRVLGASIINVIVIIGFLGWMGFARVIRSQVLTLKERPFIEAARAAGAGTTRIITRHIFPNIVSLTYVNLALTVPAAILTESALAFLGLSDPSVVSWGNIYQNAESAQALRLVPPPWWWLLPPGINIALVSLSFILVGFALDEIFNPKLRRRT
jgi:peptide/nickel transport system permease protein